MDEQKFMAGCGLSIIATLILAGVCFLFGFVSGRDVGRGETKVERDTVVVIKTVRDTIKLTSSEAAGQVVATLPVAVPEVPQPPSPPDTVFIRVPDSVAMVVPLERKIFEGQYYTATVEGYRPALVDMRLRLPTQVVTETKYVTTRKWWSVTIGPQVGYGFTPAGWQPYAGVGVSVGLSF